MSAALLANFRMLARYNALANERMYAACATLSDAERRQKRPAFFKSIHGTLNHIMVGDRIWLARFEGREVPSTGLDAILYEDFDALRAARRDEDERIERFVERLEAPALDGTIRYPNNEGRVFEDPVRMLVAHLFNHQTHHR